MRKTNLLVGLFGSLALIAGATSCQATTGATNNGTNTLTQKQKQNVEALTGIKLLESTFGNEGMIKKAQVLTDNEEINLEDIEKILPSIDVLLNNGTIIESTISEEETVINEVTYQFKEVISYKDSELKDATYTLVYNKESLEPEKDDHDDEVKKAKDENVDEDEKEEVDKKPDHNKEDEVETKEKLIGLVLLEDNQNYSFEAMSKTETEEDESESKRSFKITLDETSYVKVMEKSEVEEDEKETKFAYKFVQNGEVQLDYTLKIENELDELTEVTYEVNEVEYEVKKFMKDEIEVYKVEREDANDNERTFYFEKIVNEDGTVTFVRI